MMKMRMNLVALVQIAFLTLATTIAAPIIASPAEALTVIEQVTVIDAVNGQRSGMRVIVQGDRILSVAAADSELPSGATVIDGAGKFLIPGLWDAHVHFTYEADVAQSMPSLFLANGITYVRDTGGQTAQVVAWKKWAQQNPARSPRIFISGPLLDGEPAVYDGSASGYPKLAETVASVEQAQAAVNRLAAAGVDSIKAYEMLQPDVFLAILERATELGLPVSGHVPLSMSVEDVSNAGLDNIEHLRNLENACSNEEDQLVAESQDMIRQAGETPGRTIRQQAHAAHRHRAIATLEWERCAAVLDLLSENFTRQTPTLALALTVFRSLHTEEQWRATFSYLPAEASIRWLEQSEKMSNLFAGDPGGDAKRVAYVAWMEQVIAYLAPRGMVMAGTDTPIFFMTPGFSLHLELQSLMESGFSPMQALEAATLTPARYFGLEEEMGSIAAGKNADLVLLNSNPLEDIRNSNDIHTVLHAGQVYDRPALDGLLEHAATDTVQLTGPTSQ